MRSILAPIVAGAALVGAQATAQATVHVNIDLSTQTMHVSSADGAAYDWAVSTRRRAHTACDLFPRRIRDPRHGRGRETWRGRLARLRASGAGERRDLVRYG